MFFCFQPNPPAHSYGSHAELGYFITFMMHNMRFNLRQANYGRVLRLVGALHTSQMPEK